jgi:hypothetical protein
MPMAQNTPSTWENERQEFTQPLPDPASLLLIPGFAPSFLIHVQLHPACRIRSTRLRATGIFGFAGGSGNET